MSAKTKVRKPSKSTSDVYADIELFIRMYHQKKGYCPDNLLHVHIGDPCEFCGWDSIKQREVSKRERDNDSEDKTRPLPKGT